MSSQYGSSARGTDAQALRASVQKQLERELGQDTQSREYEQFKRENQPLRHSLYERAAAWAGSLVQVSAGKRAESLQELLDTAHLSVRPGDVLSLSLLAPLAVFVSSLLLTVLLPFLLGGAVNPYFLLFSLVLGLMAYIPLAAAPRMLAQRWRQEASNQMVLCVFYIVTYMRHTSNFELALEFAADHIGPPLSLDLKKALWDVETERFNTVIDSLESYLVRWREDGREFVEAIHLIEGSLYEASEERRIGSLDKALDVMLEETYEKMLHYAQDLKSPITMLHMLGIILPVLGLVILPLAVSFFNLHWTILASLYNVILPLSVYYLGRRILSSRPTGYGSSDSGPVRFGYDKQSLSPGVEAGLIAAVLFLIGVSPILIHLLAPSFDFSLGPHSFLGYTPFTDPETGVTSILGPFGLGAGLLSIAFTLAAGLGAGWYYRRRTKGLVSLRAETRRLEDEFASALFQLGNRIGDGIPAEIAFGKVAATMEGTIAGKFYSLTANNITALGMGVREALFHPQRGSVSHFRSALIQSSMKVFVESARKGPQEASAALMSMSRYIKEMHRVDERLRDLLSEVISSMKSQINFLLPTIAGIVIGITSMITAVLGAIYRQAQSLPAASTGFNPSELFGLGIPTYYFQIVVGLYVVQITWVLAYLINGIENGVDPLSEEYIKGKSLVLSTILYASISLVIILVFNLIAGTIMSEITPIS